VAGEAELRKRRATAADRGALCSGCTACDVSEIPVKRRDRTRRRAVRGLSDPPFAHLLSGAHARRDHLLGLLSAGRGDGRGDWCVDDRNSVDEVTLSYAGASARASNFDARF